MYYYIIIIKLRWALFVTYTIIQSITSSEMCSLHLTHPNAHTRRPGSSLGFSALLKGLTSVVDYPAGAEIRTHNLRLQVQRSIH